MKQFISWNKINPPKVKYNTIEHVRKKGNIHTAYRQRGDLQAAKHHLEIHNKIVIYWKFFIFISWKKMLLNTCSYLKRISKEESKISRWRKTDNPKHWGYTISQ